MPQVEADIWQEYRDENFLVFGMAVSESAQSAKANMVEVYGLTFPMLVDTGGNEWEEYNNPDSGWFQIDVIVDPHGYVRYRRQHNFDSYAIGQTVLEWTVDGDCFEPFLIENNAMRMGSTFGAESNSGLLNGIGQSSGDLVYRLDVDWLAKVTLSVTEADFDAMLYILSDCYNPGSIVDEPNHEHPTEGIFGAQLVIDGLAEGTYYAIVDGYDDLGVEEGSFTLRANVKRKESGGDDDDIGGGGGGGGGCSMTSAAPGGHGCQWLVFPLIFLAPLGFSAFLLRAGRRRMGR